MPTERELIAARSAARQKAAELFGAGPPPARRQQRQNELAALAAQARGKGVVNRGYGFNVVHKQKPDPYFPGVMVPYDELVAIKPPKERSACGQRKLIEKQRRKAEKAAQLQQQVEYEEEYGPAGLVRRAREIAADCARGQAAAAWRSQVVPQHAMACAGSEAPIERAREVSAPMYTAHHVATGPAYGRAYGRFGPTGPMPNERERV